MGFNQPFRGIYIVVGFNPPYVRQFQPTLSGVVKWREKTILYPIHSEWIIEYHSIPYEESKCLTYIISFPK